MFPNTIVIDAGTATDAIQLTFNAVSVEAHSAEYEMPSLDGTLVAVPRLTIKSTRNNGLAKTTLNFKYPVVNPDLKYNGDFVQETHSYTRPLWVDVTSVETVMNIGSDLLTKLSVAEVANLRTAILRG